MLSFVIQRVVLALCVLWVVSVLIFIGCEILPGDVAQVFLGQYATDESIQALRLQLGLDQPAWIRYFSWLSGAIFGDWGVSMTSHMPVAKLLDERLQNTLMLAGATTLVSVPLALFLGIFTAYFSGKAFDRIVSTSVLCLASVPEFLVATLAVLLFAVKLRWVPSTAYVTPGDSFSQVARSLILPVGTLTIVLTAQIARMTRATINNVMRSPFIEMAQLKGVSRFRLVSVHALSNAVGPLANVVALNLAYLVSGIIVVETVFSFPGLATLMIDAVNARDLPVIQACAMIFCFVYVVLIFAADILAIIFDPRSKRSDLAKVSSK